MAAPSARRDSIEEREFHSDSQSKIAVSMHSTRPERSVFVEENNPDGWIATDVTVDLER